MPLGYESYGNIYCPSCAEKRGITATATPVFFEEWDHPLHCEVCREFLDVPLTEDGVQYVIEKLKAHLTTGAGQFEVLYDWALSLTWYGGLDQADQEVIERFLELLKLKEEVV